MGDEHPARDVVLDEAITAIREQARAHLDARRGHMTWAEAVVVLQHMKEPACPPDCP